MLQVFSRITVHNFVIKKIQYDNLSCPFFVQIGQFQKISIRNHGGLPCFNSPPCLREFQNALPPMPSEFHNREPPLPFRISVLYWKYIFDLATSI